MKRAFIAVALIAFSPDTHGFGGKPSTTPKNTTPTQPSALQAKPFRFVSLAHVTTPAFFFPNGTRADFNADLDQLIDTEINKSKYLRTQISTPEATPRLIISGGITTLEMDVLQLNLKIGWNPSGPIQIGIPPVASGEVDVRLSALSMDFKIYDRVTGETYLASYTDKTLSKININAKVNLANVQGSLDILYKTKMADAIRKATSDIIANIENSSRFDLLPWEARVIGVDYNSNTVMFNAGDAKGIKQNQVYSIYSYCSNEEIGLGCFERHLSDIKISKTGAISSEAVPFSNVDSIRSVTVNDHIFVKILNQGKP